MSRPKNVLWIMCDQLRFDYLGCTGHPTLKTPNIDAMARRGVRFSNAYVQSPICGPSRMSFYTGRYMRSHGSHWNGWPLRVGEPTLGDHLREIGVRTPVDRSQNAALPRIETTCCHVDVLGLGFDLPAPPRTCPRLRGFED